MTIAALLAGACSGADPSSAARNGELAASVASYDLAVGTQRFLVGLRNRDQALIGGGTVELSFSYLGTRDRPIDAERVEFSKTAHFLAVPREGSAQFSPPARPSVVAAALGSGVYATEANFDRPGFWNVRVVAGMGSTKTAFEVLPTHRYPWIGEPAARKKLTVGSTDVPPTAIDSRAQASAAVPDPELHATTVERSLKQHRPVMLVVSTPVYCVSRFCGPITDLVGGLSRKYSSKANFIHIEVWEDFQNGKVNSAAAEWIERDAEVTEPWVFLIDSEGKIAGRWDNVVSASDLEAALTAL